MSRGRGNHTTRVAIVLLAGGCLARSVRAVEPHALRSEHHAFRVGDLVLYLVSDATNGVLARLEPVEP